MLLNEITVNELTVYHSSYVEIQEFNSRPIWFSTNKSSALSWHQDGVTSYGKQITYECKVSGKIADEQQAEHISKSIWPDSSYMYSMFDKKVREFKDSEIDDFISKLKTNGFIGAFVDDYDPSGFEESGSTRSLFIFDGSKVDIVKVLKDNL